MHIFFYFSRFRDFVVCLSNLCAVAIPFFFDTTNIKKSQNKNAFADFADFCFVLISYSLVNFAQQHPKFIVPFFGFGFAFILFLPNSAGMQSRWF